MSSLGARRDVRIPVSVVIVFNPVVGRLAVGRLLVARQGACG
jgi:hypothetical protein